MSLMAGAVPFGAASVDQLLLSIASDPGAVRTDAVLPLGKPAQLVAAAAGLAYTVERTAQAFRWSDVREIRARRGTLVVKTEQLRERTVTTSRGVQTRRSVERRVHSCRLVVDEVEEPRLAATFAAVLEEMRTGRFSWHGTPWHDHLNALDRLRGDFSDQDDDVVPIAAAGLWLSVGVMMMFLVAVLVNGTAIRAVPPGAFSLMHRVGALDPRAVIAAFACSALVTAFVLRIALGPQSLVWARGAARGWHERPGRLRGLAVRSLGRLVLARSSSATILLLALLSFWPNIAATVLVDRSGIRNEVLLPFISLEQPWHRVVEIARTEPGAQRRAAGVRFRLADGRELSTDGLELGGGTSQQLYELSMAWSAAAR